MQNIFLTVCIYFTFWFALIGCTVKEDQQPAQPLLSISENRRFLVFQNGEPFFWLGGTTWGMSEWLTREDVDYYLDNRKTKGFNLVQICLFWGKRADDPVNFSINPPNAYGFKAFREINGSPSPTQPWVTEGGTPQNPNDYWDHVDYILSAADQRNMIVAILPVWGRRYVNATHKPFAEQIFSESDMRSYGDFLGKRYKSLSNIIWVMGGDVSADAGGDYRGHYRAMAEGILKGTTGRDVKWDEPSPYWDQALMTYHPDGNPMKNSSRWFHQDAWLDFNMIETHRWRDSVYKAVQQDYQLVDPVKPTVVGEPGYEGDEEPHGLAKGIHMRRQAYHSFFAGAAGFTYGAFRDAEGNGPLFSPFKGWKKIMDMDGANSMRYVKSFCLENGWPLWSPVKAVIHSDKGQWEFRKVAVYAKSVRKCLIYFPDNSQAILDLTKLLKKGVITTQWYNPKTGDYDERGSLDQANSEISVIPPADWEDAILILSD